MTRIAVTLFTRASAKTKRETTFNIDDLATRIRTVTATAKDRLPWLKLARFGTKLSDKGSLRHDGNVEAISGIEADYDGGKVSFEDACDKLTDAGVEAIVYTSPSHDKAAPRWRVLAPFSEELPPEQRDHMMGRLNGLFGGIFSVESWTLSQSYYYGSINHNPAHHVETIDGTPIDEHDELDLNWLGKPDTEQTGRKNGNGNGHHHGRLDVDAMRHAIRTGESYHEACIRLLGRWAQTGVAFLDAQQRLLDLFDEVFPADRDGRWRVRRDDVPRLVRDIYGKQARKEDAGGDAPREGTTRPRVDRADVPTVIWADVSVSSLATEPIADRGWVLPGWIPTEQTTGLYGPAGVNKTDWLLQLCMAKSRGLPFCGMPLTAAPTYALFCEDTQAEIMRRAARIAAHWGSDLTEFPDCHFASLVGVINTEFVTFDGAEMIVQPTFVRFCKAVAQFNARLAVLDTIPDFFGGEEISRRQVAQFIRLLDAASMTLGCGIVFSAHPSVRGQTNGAFDSGTTGWGAKLRSRISLHDPGEDDEDPDEAAERRRKHLPSVSSERRTLILQKSNYAQTGATIDLICRNGVFTTAALDPAKAKMRAVGRNAAIDAKFLELFPKAEQTAGYLHNVSISPDRFAPSVIAMRSDRGGFNKHDFTRAMQRLLEKGSIRLEPFSKRGRGQFRLTIAAPRQEEVGI
jgi:hypothetical protein